MRYTYILLVDENGNYVTDDQGRYLVTGTRKAGVMSGRSRLFSSRSSLLTGRGAVIATGPQLPDLSAPTDIYGSACYGQSHYSSPLGTGIYGQSLYSEASYS